MREALDRLAAELCPPQPAPQGASAEARDLAARCVVALPAGGFGYRMRGAADGVSQKALLPLPSGETLIGRLVREYAEAGFRRFVALVNHDGRQVQDHLGDGSRWGVEIACSHDPEPTGSGRTGAMVHAMNTGALPEDRTLVVHNADCHLMRYPGSFPNDLLLAHARAVGEAGALATLAAVDGTRYPYTGMSISDGLVRKVEMYPFIPVPTHTGITVLEPEALADLRARAPETKQNFEQDMFPRWAAAGRLGALVVSGEHWIAVDDRKAYRILSAAVTEETRG